MSSVDTVISRAWQVLQASPAALITDVDGTISRIAPTPEEAFVGEPARTALRTIAPHLALAAVVTGREALVARSMVGVEGLIYVGNYALDDETLLTMDAEELQAARAQIVSHLDEMPCVEVEDKGISFSLHYRGCEDRPSVRRALLDLAGPIALGSGAKLVEGKSVLEIVPASLPDKGTAVRHLLDDHAIRGVVYFGDDIGDVAAFRELISMRERAELDALTVAIVDAETDPSVRQTADETLNGVDDMEAVLTALAGLLGSGGMGWSRE